MPNGAASSYKAMQLLHLSSIVVNGGSITAVGNDGVQVVAYLGDVDGSGTYNGIDAVLLARVATLLDTGFAAYPLLDPAIVGDIAADGVVNGTDVTLMNTELAGMTVRQIPSITPGLTITPTGSEPMLSIPTNLTATPGGTVVVPVNIDDPDPVGGQNGVTGASLAIDFDPSVFTVAANGVSLGALTAGWTLTTDVNSATGQVGISLNSAFPLTGTVGGSLALITFQVKANAGSGLSAINLAATNDPNGSTVSTLLDSGSGQMALKLPVTNGPTDPGVDGAVDIDIPTHFAVAAAGVGTAGIAITFTVTALDQNNNIVTTYAGTVHFSSNDPQAVPPADATLSSGAGTFTVTFKTAGSDTVTASDVTGGLTGTSSTVAVSAAAATHFAISAPSSATQGTPLSFTVHALDQFNNTVSGYAGTVAFTSTDKAATLPANATLSAGVGIFNATLNSTGNQTLSAADTVSSSISATSGTIAVAAAVLTPDDRYITALFQTVLGRSPAPSELTTWVAYFNEVGRSELAVTTAIETSTEARSRLVNSWYVTYLGRQAKSAEIQGWVQMLAGGATEDQVQADILSSTEFTARANSVIGGTNPTINYIEELYAVLFNRAASASEANGWVSTLQLHGEAFLDQMLLESTEHRILVVNTDYVNILHRTGANTEVLNWVNSSYDLAMIRYLIESSEEFYLNG